MCLDFGDTKRYYHLELSKYLQDRSKSEMRKGRRYRFLYNEVDAKRHIFRDYVIKRVFEDKDLNYKKKYI